jgi:hypothetical protein
LIAVSRHPFRLATTLFITLAGCLTEAGAVKREVIKTYQEEFAEHSYRLRVDLQGTNYLSVPNVVTDRGFNYQGRQFPVMFRELQTVYLARFSNAGGNEVALTIYRTKEDAEQVRGAVPSTPFGPAAGTEIALGAFARDLSTTVTLVLQSEKKDLGAQKDEILRLLNKLFYIKTEPTAEEKEAFIRSHADLPLPKLSSLTGMPEEMIRAILETAKTAPQLDDTEKEEKKE